MKKPIRRTRRLISRTDLARMAGVSQAAITKACKGKLAPGVAGDRVDLDAPCVQSYLREKGWTDGAPPRPSNEGEKEEPAPTSTAKARRKPPTAPTAPAPPPVDERRQALDQLELEQARERLRGQQLKNEEAAGRLIPLEGVRVHVFGAISTLYKRFLEDVPHTLASRLLSAGRAGVTLEQAEAIVVEVVQGQLEAVKAVATEALRDNSEIDGGSQSNARA